MYLTTKQQSSFCQSLPFLFICSHLKITQQQHVMVTNALNPSDHHVMSRKDIRSDILLYLKNSCVKYGCTNGENVKMRNSRIRN